MMSKLRRAYAEGGGAELCYRGLSYCYKTFLRPLLPIRTPIVYSGVRVGFRRAGDSFLAKLHNPPSLLDIPDYEEGLVKALRENICQGDSVVIIGGGMGVTAVVAAIAVSEKGRVLCFEGDLQGVHCVSRAAILNGVSARLTVRHALVGKPVNVYGKSQSAITIHPRNLPACDILELDCEGSELGILRDMVIQPRLIAVETHGFLGSPTSAVRDVLECRGYDVIDSGWAEPRMKDFHANHDVRVLVGSTPTFASFSSARSPART